MNLPARLRRRSQRDAEAVKREFWARVALRNGCVPPPRLHVDEDDEHQGPPVWLGVLIPLVAGAIVALLIVAGVAVARHLGWIGALGLVLAGATWSVR